MAVTQNTYTTTNATTTNFAFTFPYLVKSDVKVKINGTTLATTEYTWANATEIQLNTAAANGDTVIVYRNTANDTKRGTFYAGSAIKAEDLNENFDQVLYVAQEVDNNAMSTLGDSPMQGNMEFGKGMGLVFEGDTENAFETTLKVTDPTADQTYKLPNNSTGTHTIVSTGDTGSVTSTMITNDTIVDQDINSSAAITLTKLGAGALPTNITVASANLVDGTIVTADIADNAVTADEIASKTITGAEIANDTINSEHYAALSIDREHLAADIVDGTKIADNAIDSEHYAADSIDSEHYAPNSVDADALAHTSVTAGSYTATDLTVDAQGRITAASSGTIARSEIANDAIDGTKIEDNAINSEHYVDGSIDHEHLAADIIDGDNIQNDVINSEHYVADSIDTEHYAPLSVDNAALGADCVTAAKIADDAVQTEHLQNARLTTLSGMNSVTASTLAAASELNSTIDEIDGICDGMTKQATITDSDVHYPTSGAVVDYVEAQLLPFGGFEVIADEDNFPSTQPVAGVVISISNAGGIVVQDGTGGTTAGRSTTARTVGNGSDNVTINNFPSSLQGTTLAENIGLMVSSTGSSQTYNYHKILGKEDDIKQLSDDINDFKARYRVASSAPGSNNDAGDLYWDTSTNRMKVYNATTSAWDDVAQSSSSHIVTLSPAFDGSTTDFTMSTAATDAQSTIVSINGVIQKPNAGTSTPSEGFAISSNTLKLSNAPATGSDYFVVVLGDTVSIGTPSDNTVDADILQSGCVTTAKIAADAVDGTKIADNAIGSEHIETLDDNLVLLKPTGVASIKIGSGNAAGAQLFLDGDSNGDVSGSDYCYIEHNSDGDLVLGANNPAGDANCHIKVGASDEYQARFTAGGSAELRYANSKKFETTSWGVLHQGGAKADGTGYFKVNDSGNFYAGNDEDLKIYHDGSNSYINNSTGTLRVRGSHVRLCDTSNNTFFSGESTSTKIYHNDSVKLETTSSGITVTGTAPKFTSAGAVTMTIGSTNASGTYLVLDGDSNGDGSGGDYAYLAHESDGDVVLCATNPSDNADFELYVANGTDKAIIAKADGAVELYHDNSKKFQTVATGIDVPTGCRADFGGNVTMDDDMTLYLGLGNDLQITHDATNSLNLIKAYNYPFKIITNNDDDAIVCNQNGSVDLYHDDSKKFETTSAGVEVTGKLTFANDGLANGSIDLGADADLNLYHDNSHAYIDNNTGNLYIRNDGNATTESIHIQAKGGEEGIVITANGKVQVYDNGVCEFETTNDGIHSFGGVTMTGECNQVGQGDKYFDSAFLSHTLHFRRISDGDSGHSNHCTVSSAGVWSADFNDTSDEKLKENITTISDGAISTVKQLRPVTFDWKETDKANNVSGFIAQEVKTILPNLVYGDEYDPTLKDPDRGTKGGIKGNGYSINTVGIVAHVTKALQEAITEIETLKTKVAALEAA